MASIWRLNDQNIWVTSQNYESDQIILHCIDLTSKRSKHLSYVPKLQKQSNYNGLHRFDIKEIQNVEIRRKTFKTAKLRKWSNYSPLHRFYIKTIQNVEIRRKTFKTTQTNESDQIIMHCIDLTYKRSKLLSYVAKLQKIKL